MRAGTRWGWMLSICVLGACFVRSSLSSANDANLRARLIAEAPPAWSKIVDLSKHLEETFIDNIIPVKGDETRIEWHNKFAGNKWLITAKDFGADGTIGEEWVRCLNSRYAFHLTKSRPRRPWVIVYVGLTSDMSPSVLGISNFGMPQLYLGPSFLPDLFSSKPFTIKNVEAIDLVPEQLISVTFECPDLKVSKDFVPRAGVFLLNPTRLWAVAEFDIEVLEPTGKTSRWKQKNDFRSHPADLPLLERTELATVVSPNEPPGKRVWKFQQFDNREIPDEEFTLTAFGLPEIKEPSVWASNRQLMILGGAGILCIAIAILFLRRSAGGSS